MQQKWLILSSVACGTFMATLDASIVNVALPSITFSFHTGLAQSRWVVIAYLFSITGLLLFFGKLADVIGRKTVFNCGFVIFTVGSLLCGFAGNMRQLIFFRGLQGFGAAMLMANGPAIITATFPSNERGKALGTLAMVVSAGLAIGPTLGGILVRYFTWPSVFFVNVPIGILGTVLVHKSIPIWLGMGGGRPAHAMNSELSETEAFERESNLPFGQRLQIYVNRLRYFDWLGALMWMFIQFGYSLAIDVQNVLGMAGPLQKLITFGSAGLLILFLIWEWSIQDPILNLSLFRSKIFLASNVSGLFNVIAVSSVTLLLPFYFQNVRMLSPDQVGLVMTAIPLTIFFVAPISGRLSDRYGSRVLASAGMLTLCLAMGLLALPQYGLTSVSPTALVGHLILVGAGVGLFQSPNNNTIMGSVSREHLGVASALLATVRNFGLVTGAALSTSLLMGFYTRATQLSLSARSLKGATPTLPTENFILALRYTFLSLAVICSVAVITSLLYDSQNRSRGR